MSQVLQVTLGGWPNHPSQLQVAWPTPRFRMPHRAGSPALSWVAPGALTHVCPATQSNCPLPDCHPRALVRDPVSLLPLMSLQNGPHPTEL